LEADFQILIGVLKHARGVRLKIVIFNLELCDAAHPKVPTDLDAACAAE